MAYKPDGSVRVDGFIMPEERDLLDVLAREARLSRAQFVSRVLLERIESGMARRKLKELGGVKP